MLHGEVRWISERWCLCVVVFICVSQTAIEVHQGARYGAAGGHALYTFCVNMNSIVI